MSYAQTAIVAKAGGDFTSIQAAIDSITDATATKRYLVWIHPGFYAERVTLQPWIDLRGVSKHDVLIDYASSAGALGLADFTQVEDLQFANSATEGHWGIVGSDTSHCHIRNCDFLAPFGSHRRGSAIKITGNSWGTLFIEHCVVNCYTQTNAAIRLERGGFAYADVTLNDVFVDSLEATSGGSVLLVNLSDTQVRDLFGRTSSGGYMLRVAGTLSEVELVGSYLRYGAPSLRVEPSNTVRMFHSWAQSIGGGGTVRFMSDDGEMVLAPINASDLPIGAGLEVVDGVVRAIPAPPVTNITNVTEVTNVTNVTNTLSPVVGLVMLDGATFPPIPLEAEDGADWLCADGVS